MKLLSQDLNDSLYYPNDEFIQYILNRYREHLWEVIQRALGYSNIEVEKLVPIYYIGFLFDHCTEEESYDNHAKRKLPNVKLRYYFLPDQKQYANTREVNGVKVCNILERRTWGLPYQSEEVNVNGGLCAPLLLASRYGRGTAYITSWGKKRVYTDKRRYSKDILEAENEYFEESRDMLLLSGGNTVLYIHFKKKLELDERGSVLAAINKTTIGVLTDLLENNWGLPRVLSEKILPQKEFTYYRWMIDEYFEDEYLGELRDWAFDFDRRLRINWREFSEVPEIVSHGEEHARNVTDLLGSFFYKKKIPAAQGR